MKKYKILFFVLSLLPLLVIGQKKTEKIIDDVKVITTYNAKG